MKPAACYCGDGGAPCTPCLAYRARKSRAIADHPDPDRDARLHELEQTIAEQDEKTLKTRLAAERKLSRVA